MSTHLARPAGRPSLNLALLFMLPLLLLLATPRAARAQEGAITAPAAGARVSALTTIAGYAHHPEFRKWQLDLLVGGNPEAAHFLALGEEAVWQAQPLTQFDSSAFPDGQHLLRLRVVHTNLNYDEIYSPILIANSRVGSALVGLAEALPSQPAKPEVLLLNPAPLTPAPPAAPLFRNDVPAGERWISINLSDQTLTAWQGKAPVFETIVSTGKPDWETLPGTFAVYLKFEKTRMRGETYDTPDVPWTMYYSGDFAIHGAYWHNNFGTPVSHGCVNMRVEEAKALFEWAPMGTRVVVTH